ncbi:hypothetical protein YW3DRAFT_07373 [Streptomyces sp. MnatMP-M77]|uniref:hypothetical protein n=1 Tax=unclassified Streptomyces TaxID=2593676 RepID=UPI000804C883|nr:hypothetical protein [Streptomyces sp. MnatMP-M77]MYT83040.1 hypothetical protein [Streptomyces sp. SID8364]SBV06201.1 hypothetical protein YW3DRAFT_07373 [Streptomyces sp. MnatMP-M77]
MTLETGDRISIAVAFVGIVAQMTLSTVMGMNLALGFIFSLLHSGFMVWPLQRKVAVWNFDRARKRSGRMLADSNRALDETSRLSTILKRAIADIDLAVKNAEKDGGLPPGEYERLAGGLEVTKRQLLVAHEISRNKFDALNGISDELDARLERVKFVLDPRNSPTRRISLALTNVAVFLAGPENSHLGDAWNADLAGVPEEGYELSAGKRIAHASGFICAAFRIRITTALQRAWKPVDWLLVSNQRVNSVITALTGMMAIYLSRDISDLLNAVFGPCGVAFLALKAASVRLRQMRGIELEPIPRKEGSPGE